MEANVTANVWGHVLVEDGVAQDDRLDAMDRSDCKGDPRAIDSRRAPIADSAQAPPHLGTKSGPSTYAWRATPNRCAHSPPKPSAGTAYTSSARTPKVPKSESSSQVDGIAAGAIG